MDHAGRRDRLRALLAELDVEAALVTRLVTVRYLSGFSGSNGALLVRRDGRDLIATDGRYTAQVAAQVPDVEAVIERAVAPVLAGRAAAGRLAFEAHDVTVEAYDVIADAAAGAELVRLGAAVEALRTVKDEDEIALLREACAVADRAFAELAGTLRPGRTERDVAHELEDRMRAHGAAAPSFETIVASGPNSAVPHHRPTERVLERGDFVKLDFGALVAGYHSDMTRTVVLGEPADWQRDVYELVASAQAAGRRALTPGADVQQVDAAARAVIDAAGHGADYPHGLGHGVGLEIHEAPTLGTTATGTLGERMPVTVEPGVYLVGRGGVRIEDTLVVRPDGPELLTTTTKDLLVL